MRKEQTRWPRPADGTGLSEPCLAVKSLPPLVCKRDHQETGTLPSPSEPCPVPRRTGRGTGAREAGCWASTPVADEAADGSQRLGLGLTPLRSPVSLWAGGPFPEEGPWEAQERPCSWASPADGRWTGRNPSAPLGTRLCSRWGDDTARRSFPEPSPPGAWGWVADSLSTLLLSRFSKRQSFKVVLGAHSLSHREASKQTFDVLKFIPFPGYSSDPDSNDIMLVQVGGPALLQVLQPST